MAATPPPSGPPPAGGSPSAGSQSGGSPSGRSSLAGRAAVLRGPRALSVEPVARPDAGPGEVVVRVLAAGLCGTDYRIWNGDRPVRYPLVMGHEFIGRVAATGPGVDHVRAGDKVAVQPNYSCGRCPLCREGNWNLCAERITVGIDVDGGFAEA